MLECAGPLLAVVSQPQAQKKYQIMCGLTGFWSVSQSAHALSVQRELRVIARSMGDTLAHRGPDGRGEWADEKQGIALAHRRLSIVDVSAAGHQPMISPSGRWVIAYNGEIYNHLEIRRDLESGNRAPRWRGHSDTETLLSAFDAWGIAQTVEKAVGMFAFAVWDRKELNLTLARDRLGEKPLYYGRQKGTLLFGSELKALAAHPDFCSEVNREALLQLMQCGYVRAPISIYRDINKLWPGTLLVFERETENPEPKTYWSAADKVMTGISNPFTGSTEEAVDALELLLDDAIAQQMIADVPVGAFLSGGIDSSTIVALMQSRSSRPIKTFSIGFGEIDYNEAHYANAVAEHFRTDHAEVYVSPEDARNVIPSIPQLYDEPFADAAQIPTFLLSSLARQKVTVSLSGDAGDELFGGYERYRTGYHVWKHLRCFPRGLRALVSGAVLALPPQAWDAFAAQLTRLSRHAGLKVRTGIRRDKIAKLLACADQEKFYDTLICHWTDPRLVVIDEDNHRASPADMVAAPTTDNFIQHMMMLDAVQWLPDDILVKVDRAAMGVGLETRMPFLDHRVFEFAWRIPLGLKFRERQAKWILRQVLFRHMPRELADRPKMGFLVPIDTWLRGPLRDWAENLIDASKLRQDGFFHWEPIRKMWDQHISCEENWQFQLWDVLMFQAWKEIYIR